MPSITPAAWEVLPLASSVEKQPVSFLVGQVLDEQGDVHLADRTPILSPELEGGAVGDHILPSISKDVIVHTHLESLQESGLP